MKTKFTFIKIVVVAIGYALLTLNGVAQPMNLNPYVNESDGPSSLPLNVSFPNVRHGVAHDRLIPVKPQSSIQVIDSIYEWVWNTNTVEWQVNPIYRTVDIAYDASDNLQAFI